MTIWIAILVVGVFWFGWDVVNNELGRYEGISILAIVCVAVPCLVLLFCF